MTPFYHATQPDVVQLPLFALSKVCATCGIDKSLEDYTPVIGGKHGRAAHCRDCVNAKNRAKTIAKNGPVLVPRLGFKFCATCNVEKELNEFSPAAEGRHGRVAHCRECANVTIRARRAAKRAHDPIPKPGHRFCLTCKAEKAIGEFYQGRNECKDCRRAYSRANSKRRRDTPEFKERQRQYHSTEKYKTINRANVKRWQQTPRGRKRARENSRRINATPKRKEFDRQRRLDPKYQEYHRAYSQRYIQEYPEKANEIRMRRVARQKGATVGKVDYKAILDTYGYRCHICGKDIDPSLKRKPGSLVFDHVKPLAGEGENKGTHSQDNLLPAHRVCNNRKGARPLESLTKFDRRGPDDML